MPCSILYEQLTQISPFGTNDSILLVLVFIALRKGRFLSMVWRQDAWTLAQHPGHGLKAAIYLYHFTPG
ncbi:MAG: hypothetical protein K9H64_19130 [Bacteroidales bacterium]|nr:hypothetical protein [Bacteroidales bacterium]MCF8458152.1 hypothetical protein [Bacteroidales bacterium]